jgi:hypothetical protein
VRGSPRRWAGTGLAGIALAGIALTVASCTSHVSVTMTPPVTLPQLRHLSSAIVLQAMLGQQSSQAAAASGCPAGYVALAAPGVSSQCYRRVGSPVTITSAAVRVSPGSGGYEVLVSVTAPEEPAVTAVTTKAYDDHGFVHISVDGRTWGIPKALGPIDDGQFAIALPTRSQATQLQHILVPTS